MKSLIGIIVVLVGVVVLLQQKKPENKKPKTEPVTVKRPADQTIDLPKCSSKEEAALCALIKGADAKPMYGVYLANNTFVVNLDGSDIHKETQELLKTDNTQLIWNVGVVKFLIKNAPNLGEKNFGGRRILFSFYQEFKDGNYPRASILFNATQWEEFKETFKNLDSMSTDEIITIMKENFQVRTG